MTINWLHLTDIHLKNTNNTYWSTTSTEHKIFLDDLKRQVDLLGDLDLVLLTGDLVFSGQAEQYDCLEKALKEIFDHLCVTKTPVVLPVPGNHDVAWNNVKGEIHIQALDDIVRDAKDFNKDGLRGRLENKNGKKLLEQSFEAYLEWFATSDYTPKENITYGVFPGEYFYQHKKVIANKEISIGISGINSAVTHLRNDLNRGELQIWKDQFESAPGEHQGWVDDNTFCLLLTHHPWEWFSEESRNFAIEQYLSNSQYLIHFYGHQHEPELIRNHIAREHSIKMYQGRSAYGEEKYSERDEKGNVTGTRVERSRGYCCGSFEFEGSSDLDRMKLSPRLLVNTIYGPRMVPDYHGVDIQEDTGNINVSIAKPGSNEKLNDSISLSSKYNTVIDDIPLSAKEKRPPLSARLIERSLNILENNIVDLAPLKNNITQFNFYAVSLEHAKSQDYELSEIDDYSFYEQNNGICSNTAHTIIEALGHIKDQAHPVDLVCFNELAFPNKLSTDEKESLQNEVVSFCEEMDAIVILGSYPDDDGYCVAPIFYPCSETPQIHAKFNSIRGKGFRIKAPSSKQFRTYKSGFGNFGILPCRDTYDPTNYYRLLHRDPELKAHKIEADSSIAEFIFVPCITDEPEKATKLMTACEDLSNAADAIVIYVNVDNINGSRIRSTAYFAGMTSAEAEDIYNSPLHSRDEFSDISGAHITRHTIDKDMWKTIRMTKIDDTPIQEKNSMAGEIISTHRHDI